MSASRPDTVPETRHFYFAESLEKPVEEVVGSVRRLFVARHGQLDFQITSQQQILQILGSILGVLTFAVAALGGVSLLVGGVGILTISTIAVTERTSEIGLLRALGAERGHVLALFLAEAVAVIIGLVAGILPARRAARLDPLEALRAE